MTFCSSTIGLSDRVLMIPAMSFCVLAPRLSGSKLQRHMPIKGDIDFGIVEEQLMRCSTPPARFHELRIMRSALLAILPLLLVVIPATATTRYVASNGSDSGNGASSSPYLSWNKCYQASTLGDICLIKDGTYAATQDFAANSSIAGGTYHQTPTGSGEVTFQSESADRAKVVLTGDLHFSSAATGAPVEHVTFKDITIGNGSSDSFMQIRAAHDIHFVRVHFRWIHQWLCADYISAQESEYGPFSTSSGDGLDLYGQAYQPCNIRPGNWLIETSTIHGVSTAEPSAHPDAIALDSGHGVIIRRNKFYNNCGTNLRISAQEPPNGIVVENNMMGPPVSCAVGAALVAQIVDVGTIVRYNTFDGSVQMGSPDSLFDNELWEGNIITGMVASGCPIGSGTVSRYNVWSTSNSSSCGTNNKRVASFSGWFVNPSAGNYDLTSTASTAVGAGNPSSFPAMDLDGNNRLAAIVGIADAGASEFGGTVSATDRPQPPINLSAIVN